MARGKRNQIQLQAQWETAMVHLGAALLMLLAWLHLLAGAGTGMSVYAMTTFEFPPPVMPDAPNGWSVEYALVMLAMWWVMMVAMMMPGFMPSLAKYHSALRSQVQNGKADLLLVPVLVFVSCYFLVWLGFSIAATGLQFALERTGALHTSLMWSSSSVLSATVLIAAGCYQLLSPKRRALAACRTCQPPAPRAYQSISGHAAAQGFREGWICLKSCWALMALLFVGGVMNLVWIAGLTLIVFIEKQFPGGERLSSALGAILMASGVWVASSLVI